MINQIRKRIISLIIPILYFIIICPISVLLRLINKNFIPIKFDKNKNSYWLIKYDKKRGKQEDFYKQF
tara:strand:- start:2041 stop:2244 length:204 start_codon:yes stop_codon:yes gene_type:complete